MQAMKKEVSTIDSPRIDDSSPVRGKIFAEFILAEFILADLTE